MSDTKISDILDAIDRGDTAAAEQLLPMAYQELRRMAAVRMASERAGHTLQATALVHEALSPDGGIGWQGAEVEQQGALLFGGRRGDAAGSHRTRSQEAEHEARWRPVPHYPR